MTTHRELAPSGLSGRAFYGIILAGFVLGIAICTLSGWIYLDSMERNPSSRKTWGDLSDHFVIPVCVMTGAIFGGMLGVASAVLLDRRKGRLPRS